MIDLEPKLKPYLPRLRRKHKSLYLIDLSGAPGEHEVMNVLFRPLTRREHALAEQDVACGTDPVDEIMRAAVLWPQVNWDEDNVLDELLYGVYEQIAEAIIDISGFNSNEGIFSAIMESRNGLGNIDAVMTTAICSAFSMKPKEIDDLDLWDISRLFAMAETTSEADIDIRLFLDEEYAAGKVRAMERKQNRRSKVPGVPARLTRNQSDVPPVPMGHQSSEMPPEYAARPR